jgi:hypothetical protein
MRRDFVSGILLIAGSLADVFALSLHPTSRDLLTSADPARQVHLNALVHGVALAGVPILFLGLLGLARRLAPSDLATAALVSYAFGGMAVLSAAVASGFVAPAMIEHMLDAEGPARSTYEALLAYSGHVNQGFATVYVVASSVAILLWSTAIVRSGRMARTVGIVGAVIGVGVLLAFFSGHLRLDVHGFGLVTFAQAGWTVWLGILLCRNGRRLSSAGEAP